MVGPSLSEAERDQWLRAIKTGFVLVVSLLGTALELLLTPVAPGLLEIQVGGIEIESLVETPTEMVIGVLVGIVMTIASLHVLNGLASVTERVAVSLLGPGEEPPRGDQQASCR